MSTHNFDYVGFFTTWHRAEKPKRDRMNSFLWQVLAEMDGFDGVLLPKDLHKFIVDRDGSSPYTEDELEAWLNEESEKEQYSGVPFGKPDAHYHPTGREWQD